MAGYSFPILSNGEILICLNELNINITEDALANPTPQTVQMVYAQFLELLMNITRDDMVQPQFSAMEILEFQELHEDSIPTIAFLRGTSKLMRTVGLSDFCLNDIMKPDYKRLRRNLSAVINFAKFREERLGAYQEYSTMTDQYAATKQMLEDENEKLLTELRTLSAQRAEEEPETERLDAENHQLAGHISELNKQQAGMQQAAQELKKKVHEEQDKISNVKFMLLNSKQEYETLKSQIVHSPEKLKKTLRDLSSSVEADKENLANLETKARQYRHKSEALAKAEKDIQKTLKMMEECEMEEAKCKKVWKSSKECQQKVENNMELSREDDFKEHQMKRQCNSLQEKLSRMHKQHTEKQGEADSVLQMAQGEFRMLEEERINTQKQVVQNELQITTLREQILKLRMDHEGEQARAEQQTHRLAAQVQAYHQHLFAAIQ